MSKDGRRDDFEDVLKAALSQEAPPHLAARIALSVAARREAFTLWRIFSPGRVAMVGGLALATGAAIGFLTPLVGMLDTDMLMAAAFAGSFS